MNDRDLLLESLGLGPEKENENEKITIAQVDATTNIITFDGFTDEDEEEIKVKSEKALEDFKRGFKGEITSELLEKVGKQIEEQVREQHLRVVKELEEEREMLKKEKDRLRQEEFEAELQRLGELESLEKQNSELDIVEEKQVEQPTQHPIGNTTQVYVGQQELEKKKLTFGKRLQLKFKKLFKTVFDWVVDIIQWVIVAIVVTFVCYIVYFLANPSVEVPAVLEGLVEWLRPYFNTIVSKFLNWLKNLG